MLDVFQINKAKFSLGSCHLLRLREYLCHCCQHPMLAWDEFAISAGGKTASTVFCVVVVVNNPCTAEIRKTNAILVGSLVSV